MSGFSKYKDEAQKNWGNTNAYYEHVEKTKNYSKDKWNSLYEEMNSIFAEFALHMKNNLEVYSKPVLDLVAKLQEHITNNYYHCSKEILLGLGQMYVCDERFKKNIDKNAEGTAAYVSEAVKVYCK